MLKPIGAASAPKGFEKEAGFPREEGAAQVENEGGIGRPIHRWCGDLTLEKHSPVKKDVSPQGFVAATAGLPARQGSGHNFISRWSSKLEMRPPMLGNAFGGRPGKRKC